MSETEKPGQVIPKEITQLLERRATLSQWLGKLDELQETVRAEVHERVRADYQERLRRKEGELAAHRSEMETALQEHRTRVTALEADRDQQAAELEEAELRFAVGEFKESEYKKRKGKHDEALADLDSELESDRGALEELQEVVAVLAGLGEGGTLAQQVGSPSWTPREQAEPEDALADSTAEAPSEEATSEAIDEDSIQAEAEQEEPDEAAEEEVPSGETAETATEAAAPAATEDYLDDLEFLESLSMDDIDRLDSVSAILAEEPEEGAEEGRSS
jgi:hypothetical protein